MAKTPFTEQDILKRGYVWDDSSKQYVPKTQGAIVSGLINFPSSLLPAKESEPKSSENIKLEWFIPYQTPSKKTSQVPLILKTKEGKQRVTIIPSTRYKEYVKVTEKYWSVFAIEFKRAVKFYGLSGRLNVDFTFIRKDNKRFDFYGPGESTADLMQEFGWIENDDTAHFKPHFSDPIIDKNNPGVKIKLLVP